MGIEFIDVKYKEIFNKLNLKIEENKIISIVGKNGSGKTSFLNLIYGLNLNFNGEIIVGKNKINNKIKNNTLKEIRKNIFYLQQEYENQLLNIYDFENIKHYLSNSDVSKLDELLKTFELNKEILNKNYFELSNGEIKKILIITMFIRDSKIILLDDPTKNLDQKSVTNLIKLLKKYKRNGKIILISSQDSEFLLSISDKIVVLENGKLTEQDNKYEFFGNHTLSTKCGLDIPNVLKFREIVIEKKDIKLVYRDNINDLLKDIYRNAK